MTRSIFLKPEAIRHLKINVQVFLLQILSKMILNVSVYTMRKIKKCSNVTHKNKLLLMNNLNMCLKNSRGSTGRIKIPGCQITI